MTAGAARVEGFGPDREFRVVDPDGYCVMVTDADALVPPG